MPKKRKTKRGDVNAKAMEKRLERYGKAPPNDNFGKPTHKPIKAKPLAESNKS